jgi:hypothetical protein
MPTAHGPHIAPGALAIKAREGAVPKWKVQFAGSRTLTNTEHATSGLLILRNRESANA